MVNNSYIVVIHNHRGHGKYNEGKEYFTSNVEENIFSVMVKDLKAINSFIKCKFKDERVFLIGHSMGAYLSLKYSEVYGDSIDGLILSGIGIGSKTNVYGSYLVSKFMCGFMDASKPSKFVSNTFYNTLNRSFRGKNKKIDDFEFTTSNKEVIDNYNKDSLRIKKYTLKFYHDLFSGIKSTLSTKYLGGIPKSLNILLLTGSLDPVCSFNKGSNKLSKSLTDIGIYVEHIIYDGARHEIFVEDVKYDAFNDILIFLSNLELGDN